jgi:hypothetical protein
VPCFVKGFLFLFKCVFDKHLLGLFWVVLLKKKNWFLPNKNIKNENKFFFAYGQKLKLFEHLFFK